MKNMYLESLLESIYLCEGSPWRARDVRNLTEASQGEMGNKTVTSLFRDIKSKAFNLDFADVEVGKGDITRINSYKELQNAISYLKKLSMNVKSPALHEAITQIDACHNTLLGQRQTFTMGFKLGNNLIIYLFNSVAVALVQATSFVVAQSVETVKDNMNTYHCELKEIKVLPKNANLSALKSFNEMAKSGKLNTAMSHTLKLKEDPVLITMGVIGAVIGILVVIRELVFCYFYVRIQVAGYLKHLREFVLMNTASLGTDQKAVKEKQEKIAKNLGELADRISVDQDMATERSGQGVAQSNKSASTTNTPSNSGELSDILY